MLFSSPVFFAFFALYFVLHVLVPPRYRIYLIIAGSTIFYAAWRPAYVSIPYLLAAVAIAGTSWMEQADSPAVQRRRAILTVVVLFLPLVFFKYTNFLFRDVLGAFAPIDGGLIDLPLPLGISFVTFTLTAYVVDIYRAEFKRRSSTSTVLAYVLFFPHLIAGPILRPVELVPQLEHPRPARQVRATAAIAVFTLGLVKKLVFADQIAPTVNDAYAHVALLSGPDALLALYGFSLQIYCDFSGYTDMAIGLAMLLGVHLPNNFARPYAAASVVEFWRRWHITLSFWLRDYLYIALGGNRGGILRQTRNIVVTMALGGLWHGANWTFVVWGLLHGVAVSTQHLARRLAGRVGLPSIPRWLAIALTFHFVTVAWAFFRAPSIVTAVQMLAAPIRGTWSGLAEFASADAYALALLAVFLALHRFDDHRRIKWATRKLRPEVLWPVIIFSWLVAIAVSQGSSKKFVYFDF